ncbi:uncharacterized protein KY384_005013 [Bacidia gigantensis]|uniref:uncharacterized protein n=1 Tax=Bacidia gigantensis TaxID=2732470 RepID=UPI001D049851|nr:uncharacterized protein KY384_005013 [Bacidia gigantensis]KAG8530510.1 hypothetical protein KY384_005013 [Bacidia gigantensis]
MSSDGKTGTVGISVYAAKNLGDVVYVELPEVNLQATRGDAIGAVESVKSASDIMTPVSGLVVGVNEALQESPALINKDPEGEGGWIARIEVDPAKGGKELNVPFQEGAEGEEALGLMTEVEYGQFIAE